MNPRSAPAIGAGARSVGVELDHAAMRVRLRERIRALAWMAGTLTALPGLYLLLAAAGMPEPVRQALCPLLLFAGIGALLLCVRNLTRRTELSAVAAEMDERAGLRDELKSACWFASRESTTAWEAALLARAWQTLRDIDLVTVIPVRLSSGAALTAVAGGLVLALGFAAGRDGGGDRADVLAKAEIGGMQKRAPVQPREASPVDRPQTAGLAAGVTPPAQGNPGERAEHAAFTAGRAPDQSVSAPATTQRMPATADSAPEPPAFVAQPASASTGASDRAPALSGEIAQGIVGRLQSLLGLGAMPSERAELGDDLAGKGFGGQPERERHDAEQEHTTMDALAEALHGLSQATNGDRPMLNGASPQGSAQNHGQATISASPTGMRVNISEAGEAGDGAPPDKPLSEPRSVLGERTERLGAQLNRLATGRVRAQGGSEGEGFYAASQAQAARVDFSPSTGTPRGAGETALSREHVPVEYRGVVKRYFLIEHGREQ